MKEIDYNELKTEVCTALSGTRLIALATSYKDHVTVRTVCCLADDLRIYFITSKAYFKYQQIEKNPRVAFCFNNMQFEAIVEDKGHPLAEENHFFVDMCKNEPKEYFSGYFHYKNIVLLKADVTKVSLWKSGCREYLDVTTGKAHRKG